MLYYDSLLPRACAWTIAIMASSQPLLSEACIFDTIIHIMLQLLSIIPGKINNLKIILVFVCTRTLHVAIEST